MRTTICITYIVLCDTDCVYFDTKYGYQDGYPYYKMKRNLAHSGSIHFVSPVLVSVWGDEGESLSAKPSEARRGFRRLLCRWRADHARHNPLVCHKYWSHLRLRLYTANTPSICNTWQVDLNSNPIYYNWKLSSIHLIWSFMPLFVSRKHPVFKCFDSQYSIMCGCTF